MSQDQGINIIQWGCILAPVVTVLIFGIRAFWGWLMNDVIYKNYSRDMPWPR